MVIQTDAVAQACNLIAREIRDYQRNLTVHFIVHHEGQRTEAFGMTAQDILTHPASETAMQILQKQRKSQDSSLIGTAIARQKLFFGLATRDSVLALCTINVDRCDSVREAKRQAYHLAWHALDAADYHSKPRNRAGQTSEVLIRRRSTLEMARANLCADVFSAAISTFHRDQDAPRKLALLRGRGALYTRSLFSPEYFPYIVSYDAAAYAIAQADPQHITRKKFVPAALRIAHDVGRTFDEITLKSWLSFAEPSQDMAWRGYSAEEILGAAINTSPNTAVRTVGYMISELCAIRPASILKIKENYSPFAEDSANETLHQTMVDHIYRDVVAQGLSQNSGLPFLRMANMQNSALTEGKIMGWCAGALQAAGMAFDSARHTGEEPELTATREFMSKKQATPWDDLGELGRRVIRSKRTGHNVAMEDLQTLCRDIEGLKQLRQSVERTMSDPQFQPKTPAPRAEPAVAPKGPAPKAAPAPHTPAPAGPSMGGMGPRAVPMSPVRQVRTTHEKERRDEQGKKDR